jgi:hypothetical protein
MKDEMFKLVIAKLDKLDERLDEHGQTLTRNTSSLQEHIRRTEILEGEMQPVKAHVHLVNTAAKVVSGLVGAAAVLGGLAKTLGLL